MATETQRGGTQLTAGLRQKPMGGIPKLVAVSGPAAGRALAMSTVLASVGRHPTNDLVLADPRVSGVHLHLRRHEGMVHLRDAGSTNGTWIGPNRVHEVELGRGAEIVCGDTVLRLEMDDSASPAVMSEGVSFGSLVGMSFAMRELFATLERVAPKSLSILIQGETGTGKEKVARALHAASERSNGPFVVIDATSLPETLAESLLFGHERGAFTGATDRHVGFFEAADRGTVFIDEIGELPATLQAKFLRVLEQHEITRVGGHQPVKTDVRVIAATHRDLRTEIEANRFREDLYYRIAQVRVMLPALRERPEDIPLLCQRIIAELSEGRDTPIMIEEGALDHLAQGPWPGNVRELRNVIVRAAALADGGIIRRVDVAGEGFGFRGTREERGALDVAGTFGAAKERAIERFESAYLAALMKRCVGNLSLASREADLARHHLRDLLKKRGLYGLSWGDD